MNTLVQFINADISTGEKIILKSINWEIKAGEHTLISGPNASGKTILCKTLVGNNRISKGSLENVKIRPDEIKMVSFTDNGKLFHSLKNIHYYQQRFNAWDANGFLTAREYLVAKGVNLRSSEHLGVLSEIGLMDLLDMERIKLSSGQTRKLLLASVLLQKPRLLILDNPYIGLDRPARAFLNNFLDKLASEHSMTIILSGHATEIPNCIKRHIHLENGQFKYSGPQFPAQNERAQINDTTISNFNSYFQEIPGFQNQKILEFSNVSISYRKKKILRDFSWNIEQGDKWALQGPNGSGKSTIVSLIYADHPQIYSQNIQLFGKKPGVNHSIWDIKKQIGFTSPELHAYFRSDLNANEVCLTGINDSFETHSHPHEKQESLTLKLFQYFEMTDYWSKPFATLSTGHQRIEYPFSYQ